MARGTAQFSDCGRYRYLLTRTLDEGNGSCLFIMLNPSTADAEQDDPTIRRCISFARRWGMAELRVVNLFALRATYPVELLRTVDPVGSENDEVIAREPGRADLVISAWGNHGAHRDRSNEVRRLLSAAGTEVMQLGITASGEPRHPLYVPSDRKPVPMPVFAPKKKPAC